MAKDIDFTRALFAKIWASRVGTSAFAHLIKNGIGIVGLLTLSDEELNGGTIISEDMAKLVVQVIAKRLELDDSRILTNPEQFSMGERLSIIKKFRKTDEKARADYWASNFIKVAIMVENTAEEILMQAEKNLDGISLYSENDPGLQLANTWLSMSLIAKHNLEPMDRDSLSDEAFEDIRRTARSFFEKYVQDGDYTNIYEKARAFFDEPIQAKVEKRMTEISQDEFFGMPLSKAWNRQGDIARAGADGLPVNVGNKTLSGKVIIEASISDKDGNPLLLNEVDKGVQRAVGNLIDEAIRQGKTALYAGGSITPPIGITPQQIYRAYGRLPVDTTVTEQQAAEMEAAMDKLIIAPASLNFKAQIEKHKHMKQQDDYDYTGPQAGISEGTMITGQKESIQAHDGSWTMGYIIYAYPVYYRYSSIVGQIARVPNTLLLGPSKPAIKDTKQDGVQGTARSIAVRQNILGRIFRMNERDEHNKAFTNIIHIADVAADCSIPLTPRSERTLRKNIGLYLEDLRHDGKLKRFTEHKTGRKIDGYQVII